MFQGRAGLPSLLKEGNRHFSGLEEAIMRNIDACSKLSTITQTSLGPNAMNKLIINHFGKLFVTSDAATIIEQLEIQHPAAKLIAEAAKMQGQEYGDGTNFVVVFAGSLLTRAEILLKEGHHVSDIITGFELAVNEALEIMPKLVCWTLEDIRNQSQLEKAVHTAVTSKAFGAGGKIASLVAQAALAVMPPNPLNFDLDNVRVAKLRGSTISNSSIVNGMVSLRGSNGTVKSKHNCGALVLGCGLEIAMTETKGTVLITSAPQLINYTKDEESRMEAEIKGIKDAGVEVIIVGGAVSDIAQHFCDKYDIFVLKSTSKFELRRLCRTVGSPALIKMKVPTPDEIGRVTSIEVMEIASKKVTVIKGTDSRVATILLRSSTPNAMEEAERTIDDGLHCIKSSSKDPRFLPGGGATEIELATQIKKYGQKIGGFEPHSIAVEAFADALECVPHVIAANAGLRPAEVITQLHAAHQQGKTNVGVNIMGDNKKAVIDVVNEASTPVLDHFATRMWALKLAAEAATTVLRVDQIIMAKPAGGPKPPKAGHWDDDD